MAVIPRVALVGRPNVGKSSLFNRLVGQRQAIVHETAGTTRDRVVGEVTWGGYYFELVDTAGLSSAKDELAADVRAQIEQVAGSVDVIVVVLDASSMITPADASAIRLALRQKRPVILAINKIDTAAGADLAEFRRQGAPEVIAVSAIHGKGTGDLLDHIARHLKKVAPPRVKSIKVALLGRPNVGKSTLFNSLAKGNEAIVSPEAGTTRDINRGEINWQGQTLELFDTGGIRRRGKISPGIEKFSLLRTEQAIEQADIGVVVLDATEPAVAVDQKIAGMVIEAKKGLIIFANKWDLVDKEERTYFERRMAERFQFAWWAPLVEASAVTGEHVQMVPDLATQIYNRRGQQLSTPQINHILTKTRFGGGLKINYATQTGTHPPTFRFFANRQHLVHFSYRRQLENRLRESFDFGGTPIRIEMRSKWTKPKS